MKQQKKKVSFGQTRHEHKIVCWITKPSMTEYIFLVTKDFTPQWATLSCFKDSEQKLVRKIIILYYVYIVQN